MKKPLHTLSFIEDGFEIEGLKASRINAIRARQQYEERENHRRWILYAGRVLMTVIAFASALWLYSLADNAIEQHLNNKYETVTEMRH